MSSSSPERPRVDRYVTSMEAKPTGNRKLLGMKLFEANPSRDSTKASASRFTREGWPFAKMLARIKKPPTGALFKDGV